MRVRAQIFPVLVTLLLCSAAVLYMASAPYACAQATNTGTVAGTVTDPSAAVVGGATVTLTDNATNVVRTASTNSAGRYTFVDLPPSSYTVSVAKPGFATTKAENQEVRVGTALTVNLSLQVGASNVVVEVSAVGNELQTMNATVGNTITSSALDALPSIGRDVSTFVELQPGVSPEGSVAGTVNDETYFSLDGGNNTNDMDGNMSTYTTTYAGDPTGGVAAQNTLYLTGQPTGVLPTPQDSVEEFKVNTANQTADFNSSSGAEVKVVTKRGTNSWHGTGYEYYLDNNWSSNSWDNNFNGLPIPSFHYNRFGGAVGGPVIPKDLLGGKTYLFFNYEGFRFPNSETINRDVPSANLKAGLLTDATTGATFDIKTLDPLHIGLNSIVSKVWSGMPASNAACHYSLCDGVNVQGFSGNIAVPQTSNFLVGRLDHDFAKKWHFMTTYRTFKLKNATTDQFDIGGFFPGDKPGIPTSLSNNPQEAWIWVAGLTTNITPNVTNDFHYSFLRNWWQWGRQGDTPQVAGLGGALEIFSSELCSNCGHYQNLAPYNVNTQQTRTRFWDGHDQMFRDDISMLKGNHLFQFGGQYQHNFNWHQRTDNGGGINYQPVYQLGLGTSGSGFATGTDLSVCQSTTINIPNCGALTAAMLGVVSISQIAYTRTGSNLTLNPPLTPAFDQSTIPYYNVYFSDTWHMKPSLTLTYGLGWTLEMPPVEKNGKQVELVDQANQLVSVETFLHAREQAALQGGVYNPTVGFTLVGNSENGRKYPYNPFYGSFSPRVALAWNPHFDTNTMMGKVFGHEDTVIRGGYGRIYGRLNGVDLVLVPLLGTGLIQPVQCFGAFSNGTCNPAGTQTPTNAFRIGTNGLTAPIPQASQTLPQPDFPGINAIAAGAGESLDPNFRPNVVDSFDLTIQRQLSHKMTLEFGYIGRRITHEYQPININAVPYMMTKGGQQFQHAYANVMTQLGCLGNVAACGANIPAQFLADGVTPNPSYNAFFNTLTPQPFFEKGINPGFCAGFSSCTAAVGAAEAGNFTNMQVWTLWSDLDNGAFNFPRSMMNTPVPGPFGAQGQLTSGVGVNASVGYGNYNAGFVSLKMNEWRGLTMQTNFTWSKALGTGALVQATSAYTPNDPFNMDNMYGRQLYDRKFVYNTFLVYSPPFYKGQTGVMGRLLGGWTFSSVFTTGSGQPIEIFTTTGDGQEFGAGDNSNFFGLETAVPTGPIQSGHAYFTAGSKGFGDGGLPINIFKNPEAAFNSYRNPILGIDRKDTSYLGGLPYWNLDFSVRKNVRVAESISLEFQGVFANILNHDQFLDPWGMGLFSPGTFGNLLGSAQANTGGNRSIQVGARVRF
jgi:Carboxypeptidase regulatory-like domain